VSYTDVKFAAAHRNKNGAPHFLSTLPAVICQKIFLLFFYNRSILLLKPKKGTFMLFFVEILSLCGVCQMLTASALAPPLHALIPAKFRQYTVKSLRGMGFWVGFAVYALVALCATVAPNTVFLFPLAEIVANSGGCVRWIWVFVLAGLISICVIVVNHTLEILYYSKMWFVCEIERHKIAKRMLDKEWAQMTRQQDRSSRRGTLCF
jgi:hypothetical protein